MEDASSPSHFVRLAVVNLGSFAAVVTFAFITIRLRQRWESREWSTAKAAREASEAAEATVTETLGGAPEVLCCAACGAPVALGASARVTCASCGVDVGVPPIYVTLRERRADAAARLARDTAELKRVDFLMHPAWAVVWVAGAIGLGFSLVHLNNRAANAPLDSFVSIFGVQWLALLIVPVGMVISAVGQLGAWSELSDVKNNFAANQEAKQWTCRRCSAPLASEDGLSALCAYCGAQNLLRAEAKRVVAKEEKGMHALAAQVLHARAVRWHWFWTGIQIPSLLLAAIGGLLFLMFGGVAAVALLGG